MLPIADKLNRAGYWSLEMWGGATFDSMMRFLNEDPWERVRALKAAMPDTRLQMLLRGQNSWATATMPTTWCGVRPAGGPGRHRRVPHLRRPQRHPQLGDSLSRPSRRTGKWVEGTICYTMSPVHNVPVVRGVRRTNWPSMGAQSICIKDMAGLLDPTTPTSW